MEKMNTINDESFAHLVAEDVKNRLSPLQRQVLMQSENWDRWQRALLALVENLDDQIDRLEESKENDNARFRAIGSTRLMKTAEEEYRLRISRVERFKFHVNRRLDEVTTMIETGKVFDSNGWPQVEFLKRAIATHREMMRKHDMEPTPIDQALWSALIDKWEFDNIDVSAL